MPLKQNWNLKLRTYLQGHTYRVQEKGTGKAVHGVNVVIK